MTVTLKKGPGWINGALYVNDNDLILPVDVADGILNRIDRVVLRMDTLGRAINAKVKKGAFASSPVAPELQRDADGYEIGIADIYVGKGVVSIVQANITDLRLNTTYCGVVNSLIQADTTAIFNQYLDWFNSKTNQYQSDMTTKEAEFMNQFNTWFDTAKNTLGEDSAGNLFNMIYELAGEGRTTETVKGNANAIVNLGNNITEIEKKLKNYNSYGSAKDVYGIYTVVDYKRADGTLYMKSTLSNADINNNYQTDVWRFYNDAGSTVILTLTWTIMYDDDSGIISKVVN